MTNEIQHVCEALRQGKSFLIASHTSPDGDAVGSMVALGHLLKKMGKNIALYNESGLPADYSWLSLPCPILSRLPEKKYEWTIALDCGDKARLGQELAAAFSKSNTINIDHHLGNPHFAEVNWTSPKFAAVGEQIGILTKAMGLPLDSNIGEGIYLALVADTGNFTFGSTTAGVLHLAAEILQGGLDIQRFSTNYLTQWTINRLKLWSLIFDQAAVYNNGRVALGTVSQKMLYDTGTSKADTDQAVNFLQRIKGVEVAALLREDGNRLIKASLRSAGKINVQQIAAALDGGGHKNAAGCELRAGLGMAKEQVLEKISAALG